MSKLKRCIRCKQEFRQIDEDKKYQMCLDCRLEIADRSRCPTGRDLVERLNMDIGYRLTRGFNLIASSRDDYECS